MADSSEPRRRGSFSTAKRFVCKGIGAVFFVVLAALVGVGAFLLALAAGAAGLFVTVRDVLLRRDDSKPLRETSDAPASA